MLNLEHLPIVHIQCIVGAVALVVVLQHQLLLAFSVELNLLFAEVVISCKLLLLVSFAMLLAGAVSYPIFKVPHT